MKKKVIILATLALFCLTMSNVFAQKQKLKASFGGVVYNGYNFPLYMGAKDIFGNTDGSIEYLITQSKEAKAVAALEKLKKFYNNSFIVKKMGGNRTSLKAAFQRAPVEMKDVFISQNGEKGTGMGGMVVLIREGKKIRVYVFNTNDSTLIQPLMN